MLDKANIFLSSYFTPYHASQCHADKIIEHQTTDFTVWGFVDNYDSRRISFTIPDLNTKKTVELCRIPCVFWRINEDDRCLQLVGCELSRSFVNQQEIDEWRERPFHQYTNKPTNLQLGRGSELLFRCLKFVTDTNKSFIALTLAPVEMGWNQRVQ